jgi:hypothetical protein
MELRAGLEFEVARRIRPDEVRDRMRARLFSIHSGLSP